MTTVQSIDPKALNDFQRAARLVLPKKHLGELDDLGENFGKVLTAFASSVAELKQSRDRLRQSEARFREIFDGSYDAIFVVDVDGDNILDANEEACRLLGYSRDEFSSLTVSDIHPLEMPEVREFARNVFEHGRSQTFELTCRAKWGEFIPAELSATAVEFAGHPCMLVLVHDMREHRLAALGTAVSKVSHDLRNIMATAQLVCDHLALSDDPQVKRVTPRLIHTIDRAIRLCTETLAYGKAEEQAPHRTRFALHELVEDVGAAVGLPADGPITWSNEVESDFEVSADWDQIFRVLLNLARNAVEAIKEKGEVRIGAAGENGVTLIDVADTGPGLPPAARETLFQAFAGSARAGGTGLGLAIARDLMHAHGGDITLLRSDAKGTVFRLELPDQ